MPMQRCLFPVSRFPPSPRAAVLRRAGRFLVPGHRTSNKKRATRNNDALQTEQGSLLLEAIVAIGVFAIFLGGIGLTLVLGERSTLAAGDRTRAAFLAEQQLEGVRQMRTTNFSSLTSGTHGMMLTDTGWSFSGASTVQNGYLSSVLISPHETDWVDVTANVQWNFGQTRSGSVTIGTVLTNWRKVVTVGNWAAMSQLAKLTIGGTPEYQKIAIAGNYAYVTGSRTLGSKGAGLYIFDISSPASPVRVAPSFDLDAAAYGIAVNGDRLFLATDDPAKEIQVYDITSPATLATDNLINSLDLPGSGKARSIAVYGSNVFVGTLDDPPNKQFYAVLMSETGPMRVRGSLTMSGSVQGISLHDGYAYAATSYNPGELQVVNIIDPAHIAFAPGGGVDMTDAQDGNAVATFGTSALLGRLNGSTIDELTLYSIADAPVPSPPPGPWTLEIGGDVNAIAPTFGSTYAFIGGSADQRQVQVLDMIKFTLAQAPVVKTLNTKATIRGLFYDWQKDRLYGVSADSLFVFAPG